MLFGMPMHMSLHLGGNNFQLVSHQVRWSIHWP